MRLFYTSNMLLGKKLSLAQRERLSKNLGSACHLFKLSLSERKTPDGPDFKT